MYNHYNIGLCGEYRLTLKDAQQVVHKDTGWCKNTVLSSGLINLYTTPIPACINALDLGTSTLSSGEFALSGVLVPSVNAEFRDIAVANNQYYPINTDTQVYYSYFVSMPASSASEVITEFCVKSQGNSIGFSRTVFNEPVSVKVGQIVNFEYRISVQYTTTQESNTVFANNLDTFYIPTTSRTFNLPNYSKSSADKVGRLVDEFPLVLLQNNENLPQFGEVYPVESVYAIDNSLKLSTFYPVTVFGELNASTRTFTAITQYPNITANYNSGIFNNINTALLTYNDEAFATTRFKFPLAVYSYATDVLNSISRVNTTISYDISATLYWDTDSDMDLYGRVAGSSAVYYGNLGNSNNGLELISSDKNPGCNSGGLSSFRENIFGSFTSLQNFYFWYNRYSTCGDPPSGTLLSDIYITNNGSPLIINSNISIPTNQTVRLSSIEYNLSGGNINGYLGGTEIFVSSNLSGAALLYFNQAQNILSLYYMYTWGETISSSFSTPANFTSTYPQLIVCNINQFTLLTPNNPLNLYSNYFTSPDTVGNTSRVRVSLSSVSTNTITASSFKIDLSYETVDVGINYEYGPSPFKVVVYDSDSNLLVDTGYVLNSINSAQKYKYSPSESLAYFNNRLEEITSELITGITPNTVTINNIAITNNSDYVDVVINTPFTGVSWRLTMLLTKT